MKLKTLTLALLATTIPTTGVFAAALDRSGQSISAFLQPDNYFEAGISILVPTVEGQEAGTSETRRDISDMGDDYYFPSAAVKLQVTDKFSFGLLYDQPFGADAAYKGNNVFVSNPGVDTVLGDSSITNLAKEKLNPLTAEQRVGLALQGKGVDLTTPQGQAIYGQTLQAYKGNVGTTKNDIDTGVLNGIKQVVKGTLAPIDAGLGKGNTTVEVDTQNLSMIFGFQPTKNINLYGGGVYQTIKGSVSLRGQAYSLYNGYDAKIKETGGAGWLAGAAFQIPEIALKASVTYRSEIDHDVDAVETLSAEPALDSNPAVLGALGITTEDYKKIKQPGKTKITTPQSVNVDFQTGIMENTIAFANLRWVNWKDFSIQPYKFGEISKLVGPLVKQPGGFNLVEYSDDQYSVTAGVGRKVNDHWAGNVSVGWDSGAGNPVSTLGPTEGYWNVGLGVQYSPTPATFISGGVKYFWLGDAKAQTGAQAGGSDYVAEFKDNNALAYGLKLGYRF